MEATRCFGYYQQSEQGFGGATPRKTDGKVLSEKLIEESEHTNTTQQSTHEQAKPNFALLNR